MDDLDGFDAEILGYDKNGGVWKCGLRYASKKKTQW
jgi:hypothetical protein